MCITFSILTCTRGGATPRFCDPLSRIHAGQFISSDVSRVARQTRDFGYGAKLLVCGVGDVFGRSVIRNISAAYG